jgi:hypothetical protein
MTRADCADYRQAAGAIGQDLMGRPLYNVFVGGVGATENTTMQQAQLGLFFAAVFAWVVCGCIFTRKPKKGL